MTLFKAKSKEVMLSKSYYKYILLQEKIEGDWVF